MGWDRQSTKLTSSAFKWISVGFLALSINGMINMLRAWDVQDEIKTLQEEVKQLQFEIKKFKE